MDYLARWAEVASEQYFAQEEPLQLLVDERVRRLLKDPDGPSSSYDPDTDQWTTTAGDGRILVVYVLRPPWVFILRLVLI
jgi:hypothetical protein